ncbi:MAG: GGDEF domain-containing protein [Eubacteriales bacterium]|nr:GGDEF domain-containing protein [Eubacteriales bacterium]
MNTDRKIDAGSNAMFIKDKNTYALYKTDIQKRNYKMLFYVSLSLVFLGILFSIVNSLFHIFNSGTKYIYLYWAGSSCCALALCLWKKQWVLNYAIAVFYIYLAGIMISMIISGTYFYKDGASAIMIGCIASMPILLFDKQWRFCVFDISICLLFIIFSFMAKDSSVALIDCVNALSFCFISCLIGMYTIRLKFLDIRTKYIILEQLETDSLTGLMSRNAAIREIEKYYSSPNSGTGALFIIDIDHFKEINDTYGHLEGDHILIEVAHIIRDSFRNADLKARLGGDEFLVFMKNVDDTARIHEYAEYLNRNVREGSFSLNEDLYLTVSIGISLCRECANFEELYVQADTMLYEVKNENRNGYKIYEN